jgi:hypothetical protein
VSDELFEGQAARGDFQAVKQGGLDDVNGESEVMADWWEWRRGWDESGLRAPIRLSGRPF